MRDTRGPTHESGPRLLNTLSLPVRELTVQQAQSWVTSSLEQMGLRPKEQQRIGLVLTRQLELMLETTNPEKLTRLTIRLFSAGVPQSSPVGWGFFIINKPVRAAQGVVEIYIYQDSPV